MRTLTGSAITLNVESHYRWHQIKDMICDVLGVPPDQQVSRLAFLQKSALHFACNLHARTSSHPAMSNAHAMQILVVHGQRGTPELDDGRVLADADIRGASHRKPCFAMRAGRVACLTSLTSGPDW